MLEHIYWVFSNNILFIVLISLPAYCCYIFGYVFYLIVCWKVVSSNSEWSFFFLPLHHKINYDLIFKV